MNSKLEVADVDVEPAQPVSSRLTELPTLAQQQATPRAVPKPHTKLERAIANKAARLLDAVKLRTWSRDVRDRDEWKDRKTGQRVYRVRQLDPARAEAHHIEPKSTKATRYDVRNGITLSLATHLAVEQGVYRIEGTVYFELEGAHYIDGTFPVTFVRL